MCVWLGPPGCYRRQENVLCLPCDDNFAQSKSDSALRVMPSGQHYRNSRIADTVTERGGSTPFNLLPVAPGVSAARGIGHPATTPYDVAAWWVKYLLPPQGVLLDCFCGSGTMLAAGLDFGASRVIGVEKERKYLRMAEKRVAAG
jgi:DNA modification methylase